MALNFRIWRNRLACVAILWTMLGAGAPGTVLAQQNPVFYLVGAEEERPPTSGGLPQYKGVRVYELESATLRVVRSVDMDLGAGGTLSDTKWYALSGDMGMLTGDRKTIVLVDGGNDDESTLLLVSVPDLKIEGHMDIPMSQMPMDRDGERVPCLDHIFVHPVTGRTYFSCELGRGGERILAVDPVGRKVIGADLPTAGMYTRTFVYDSKRQWLYVSGTAPLITDAHDHLIGHIDDIEFCGVREIADRTNGEVCGVQKITGGSKRYGVRDMALLPDGNLVLLSYVSETPVVSVYDPAAQKIRHAWIEDRTYTGLIGPGRIHGVRYEQPTPTERVYNIYNVPVPSRDGSRLFGIEESESHADGSKPSQDGGILWDAGTLQVLHRWTLPEATSYSCSENGTGNGLVACFAPAPDGRGMWYFGKSGKVYRLDDQSGQLIEEVKLPLHLISLIREP